jgi:hypothetical protein
MKFTIPIRATAAALASEPLAVQAEGRPSSANAALTSEYKSRVVLTLSKAL